MMFEPADYNVVITRVVAGGEKLFRATVKELPDLAEYAETHEGAYTLAIEAIAMLAELAEELGHDFPTPVRRPEQTYSGRVTLRMGKSLHQLLAEFAEEDGVSLNQFINDRLSQAVGMRVGGKQREGIFERQTLTERSQGHPEWYIFKMSAFQESDPVLLRRIEEEEATPTSETTILKSMVN